MALAGVELEIALLTVIVLESLAINNVSRDWLFATEGDSAISFFETRPDAKALQARMGSNGLESASFPNPEHSY
jgi:hypothetical protein